MHRVSARGLAEVFDNRKRLKKNTNNLNQIVLEINCAYLNSNIIALIASIFKQKTK